MLAAVLIIVPVLWVTSVVVLVVQLVRVLTHVVGGRGKPPSWRGAAVALAAIAYLVACYGFWTGGFVYKDPEDVCRQRPHAIIHSSLVPLRHACASPAGPPTELVPAFVNPTIVGCLVGVVLCAGIGFARRSALRG